MKKANKNKINKSITINISGITLIALIITIVVLIILAAVAINISLGNNGIFSRAKTATEKYANAQNAESKEIDDAFSRLLVAADGTVNLNMNDLKTAVLDMVYPVGSIYITIDDDNPSDKIGGTWESVSSGKVLQGADDDHAADTTIDAGLPDHKHYGYAAVHDIDTSASQGYPYGNRHITYRTSDRGGSQYSTLQQSLASVYNSIYGNSDTVQPPAYVVHIWKRTA